MTSARERAKVLAEEMTKVMRVAKAAEARAKELSQELLQALAEIKEEAEAARTIVEYPAGRYECKGCGQVVLFTEPCEELSACGDCGGVEYDGAKPKVTKIKPPPPKKFAAGIYECSDCGARMAVAEETDVLSACDICGAGDLKAV